jgi:hypothetical protein
MAQAMGATATAGSVRHYIYARHFSWLTPRRRRAIMGLLLAGVLIGSSIGVEGSSGSTPHPSTQHHAGTR